MKFNVSDYTYSKYLDGECAITDMHNHITLLPNIREYATENDSLLQLSFGILPTNYKTEKMFENNYIKIGLGFHPWEVSEKNLQSELKAFKDNVSKTEIIGEIGLDFSMKHKANKDVQTKAFTEICEILSKQKSKVISIHAVQSTSKCLAVLKEYKIFNNNTVIYHWFSGSLEEFNNAVKSGCYFSCGPKMLRTKRGMILIQNIPEERLLFETDLPWDNEVLSFEEHKQLLNDFCIQLRDIRLD